MRFLRQAGVALALLTLTVAEAAAQRTTARSSAQARSQGSLWEIGADAALSFGLDDPRTTAIQIPLSQIRAGIHTSDVLSIEPFFSLFYFDVEGAPQSTTLWELGVGGLYHFSVDRNRMRTYVRPFVSLFDDGGDDTDVGAGLGFGAKWPKLGGRMAWRGEVNVATANDQTAINVLFGISFFTR